MHNFYVPAGDIPLIPTLNPKFEHKLSFLDEMKDCEALHPLEGQRHILVGDLNVAPYEHDAWSHRQLLKVVSHTPIRYREKLLADSGARRLDRCGKSRIPLCPEKVLYMVELPGLPTGPRQIVAERLDHIWVSQALGGCVSDFKITRDARGWERPSDHVPVTVR